MVQFSTCISVTPCIFHTCPKLRLPQGKKPPALKHTAQPSNSALFFYSIGYLVSFSGLHSYHEMNREQ